jgi:hypothetical protein
VLRPTLGHKSYGHFFQERRVRLPQRSPIYASPPCRQYLMKRPAGLYKSDVSSLNLRHTLSESAGDAHATLYKQFPEFKNQGCESRVKEHPSVTHAHSAATNTSPHRRPGRASSGQRRSPARSGQEMADRRASTSRRPQDYK